MNDLILVIDMQNVYGRGGAWECSNMERTKDNIHKLLSSGLDVAFTVFDAPSSPHGAWNEYCRVNKDINEDVFANDLMSDFKDCLSVHPLFHKSTYSSLSNPELRALISEYDRVVVTGVVAECCVLSTVMALIDEGVPFVYLPDAVSGLTDKSEEEAKAIVSYMEPVHGVTMLTDDYLKLIFRENL